MMGGADVSAAVLAGAREMIEAKANIKRKAKIGDAILLPSIRTQ